MAPVLVRLSHQSNCRLRQPTVHPPACLLDGEEGPKDGRLSVLKAQEPGDDGLREADRFIPVDRGFPPRTRLGMMRDGGVDSSR